MLTVLNWIVVVLGVLMISGTLASLTRSTHWAVRLWDFPRLQIGATTLGCALLYGLLFFDRTLIEWLFLGALVGTALFHLVKLRAYFPFARVHVQPSRRNDPDARLRVLISNVLMENREYHRLAEVVAAADADVVLLLETDDAWLRGIERVIAAYPHRLIRAQDNYYGMILLSRLALEDARFEFLVQHDIPSAHATIVLRNGTRVRFYGLHPRPPEPMSDQNSTARDAELVLVGRRIGEADEQPTVVSGDLNDVAASPSTQLFLRLSRLLDPRIGRGFYNSFHAKYPIFRYPLDHFFHSRHFRLVELRRMSAIGSDHFPMLLDVSHEPDADAEQEPPSAASGDRAEATERLEKERQEAATGEDRPARE